MPSLWNIETRLNADRSFCRSYCLSIGIASAAIYSILVPISSATSLTVGDLNAGTGYMFLTLGWGCLLWQPLAQKYGKRPVYLTSLLGTLVCMELTTSWFMIADLVPLSASWYGRRTQLRVANGLPTKCSKAFSVPPSSRCARFPLRMWYVNNVEFDYHSTKS